MDARDKKRLYLRATIKMLVATGFAFLLVPFVKSLPWPEEKLPAGSILLAGAEFAPGTPRRVDFPGQPVWVTRVDDELRARLLTLAPALRAPAAPELLDTPYFAVSGLDAERAPVQFRAAEEQWPGGFVNAEGAAWDVAGRALRQGPGNSDGPALPQPNLAPMPFQRHGDGVLLVPPPESTP